MVNVVKEAVAQKKDASTFKTELDALVKKMAGGNATKEEIAHFVQKYRGFGSIYDPRPKHMFEKQPLEVETVWGEVSEKGAKIIGEQMTREGIGFNGC